MSTEISQKAAQLRSLKSLFDLDCKEFEKLRDEGILDEQECRAEIENLERKYAVDKSAILKRNDGETPSGSAKARRAPLMVTPARPAKKARSVSSFTFPRDYTCDFDDEDDFLDEYFDCNWIIMKTEYSWGYLKGSVRTLSDWVYLRPDVEQARKYDNLTTNEIFDKGIKDVHYFFDRELATEYFKRSFTVRGVRCVPTEDMIRRYRRHRTQEAREATAGAAVSAVEYVDVSGPGSSDGTYSVFDAWSVDNQFSSLESKPTGSAESCAECKSSTSTQSTEMRCDDF